MNSETRNRKAQRLGLCFLVLLQAGWASPVWSQRTDARVTISVLDFALNLTIANADKVEQDERPVTLAMHHLRTQVANHAAYALVRTPPDTAALTEWPCTSDACAAQAGKRLSVQRVIRGQVTKVSALIWFVSARLIDVQTAKLIRAETLQFRGNMADVIPRLMTILWRRLNEPK